MEPIEILGFIAGSMVAISLLPQVIKAWRTKSTKDLSISWTLINLCGQTLWIIYGYYVVSIALMTMSSITLVMTLSLIALKLKFG